DARQGRLALADRAFLLCLDQLVQPLGPRPVGHDPPGVYVDDLDLVVAHEVVDAAIEQVERGQRLARRFFASNAAAPETAEVLAQLGDAIIPAGADLDPPLVVEDAVMLAAHQ